ncbi:biotin transporter BioY [Schaalia vaccimaxillae]|uniref:biotin transporter BioY n=1 Tax=Schaalia vaccimaxillae TaxID=183916 RepID=UPI0003B5CB72|nr:biotin transporter BioY [Schaalia vaccimaxillae]
MSSLAIPAATTRTATQGRVLADRFGGTLTRDIALTAAGTAVLTLFAQIVVPLPFTPVPVSLATLGALVVGTTLGMRRGALAALGYLLLGVVGAPVFSGDNQGWAFASFGYIVGYIAVAAVSGRLAERGADRNIVTMLGSALVASASVYVFGLAWMIPFAEMTLTEGLSKGLVPFLIGDAVKIAVAAGVFPALNALIGRR